MKPTLYPERELHLLRGLDADAHRAFRAIASTDRYPDGVILFSTGESPRGIFVLRAGKVKLSASSSKGRALTLRMAKPGEILGLSATLRGNAYEVTAETVGVAKADFVPRAEFLHFLDQYPEAYFQMVEMLSDEVAAAHQQVNLFHGVRSASGRLAMLLLAWCAEGGAQKEEGILLTVPLSEREIGQMIGASRETVVRLLSKFREKSIAQRNGQTVLIRDKTALEAIAKPHLDPSPSVEHDLLALS